MPGESHGKEWHFGIHRAIGGYSDLQNPATYYCAALASCFDATLRMVADRLEVAILFRTYYGPVFKALGVLDAGKQEALAADMFALAGRFNHATDGSMAVRSEYLEVVINRR